jgi:regulator of sigma E protease
MVMAILAIILTLILVVGIHEAGHAIAAYFFNVKIEKIVIGFGKPLFQWHSKYGWDWVWAMWPLGGYVQLQNSRISPVGSSQESQSFDKKKIRVRLIILLAGAFANLVAAWLAFVLAFYIGINFKLPQIAAVQPKSAAALAGVGPGDQFIAIEGKPSPSWRDVAMNLLIFWGNKQVKISMETPRHQLKEYTLDLSQIKFTPKEFSLLTNLGITPNKQAPSSLQQAASFLEAVSQANHMIWELIYFFIIILKHIVTGLIPFSVLLGPIGLFSASIASFTQGLVIFLYFIASFSLAVVVVNLVPIPGLDGGSIFFLLIEKIRGKPISVAMEVLLYRLIFILFALILVQLLMNDLARILS